MRGFFTALPQSIQERATTVEEQIERFQQMAKSVPVIGIDPAELGWVRLLVFLLRHPDPVIPQLTCQALEHIEQAIGGESDGQEDSLGRVD